jgi:tetratricopeptide (TPR) repeat protein
MVVRAPLINDNAHKAPAGSARPSSHDAEASSGDIPLILDTLRSVRLLRGLEAIEAVLGHYECNMLARVATSAPLAFTRALRRGWLGDVAPHETIENLLRQVLITQPDCAEAHVELGYLFLDQGRVTGAKMAFDAGSRARRFECSPIDARAESAVQLAAILSAEGEWRGAADAYRLSFSLQQPQTILRYRYADVLRHLGDMAGAKEQFAMAMNASHRTWAFPKTGRDASRSKIYFSPVWLKGQRGALVAGSQ